MKTVYQSFEDNNKDCGLACLVMLAGKSIDYWKIELRIRNTRNTNKPELLKALKSRGVKETGKGQISARCQLVDLPSDALVLGKLSVDGDELGHWVVWDAKEKCIRDPHGFRAPFRPTSYTLIERP